MKTITIFSLALLCCSLLFLAASAVPLEEESEVIAPETTIDAEIQRDSHIEIPEAVAKNLLKALFGAFQNSQISGEISAQSHVSTSGEKTLNKLNNGLQGRAGCDAGYCGLYCISLKFHGGYCTIYGACACV